MPFPLEDAKLPEVLARLSELDQVIKQSGVTKENVERLRAAFEEYDELEAALEAKRHKQFWDTAYDFLLEQKIATGKNQLALAEFLRRFASHVVREFASQIDRTTDVWDVVDHIPEMDLTDDDLE